ncbi:MAG: Uncharacterised protein [Flavobacteriales bacterium UBA4585]|nr:MAG: Uncharacterised protein [Flavobacteriales bacterium UBA4585]
MERYDIGFLGMGAANGLLLLELERKNLLRSLNVLILEPDAKLKNDKTYCFWADAKHKIRTQLKDVMFHQWDTIDTVDGLESLEDQHYYMVESIALYNKVKSVAQSYDNVKWIRGAVDGLKAEQESIVVFSGSHSWEVQQLFDSRPPIIKEPMGPLVLQSFVGWRVKLQEDYWTPNQMTLMDFGIPQNDFTQFMYVLPTDAKEALVEMTRFGSEPLPHELASNHLRNYLLSRGLSFEILHEERGVIPMTQYAEVKDQDARIVSTGARAGRVKATTGYAFKSMFEHAKELAESIAQERKDSSWLRLPKSTMDRFNFYDHLLLHILKHKPHWGKEIFESLFATQKASKVFQFLDEKSSFKWELSMFSRLPIMKFLWALAASFVAIVVAKPSRWAPILFAVLALVAEALLPSSVSYGLQAVLVFLLFLYGIPHGALDGYSHANQERLPKFILRYCFIMLMVVLFWAASPVTGLLAFLTYSAWHFGETDLREWGFPSIGLSFLWGTLLLTLILIPHSMEVNTVLEVMGIGKVTWSAEFMNMIYRMALSLGLFMGFWFRSIPWVVAMVTLSLTAYLPLATAFGIYFVLQHSLSGWNHLKLSHKWTNTEMWMKALPFTIGAVALFLLVFRFDKSSLLAWSSYFLVFLSAISLPHIYFMSKLYKDRF